MVGALGAAAAGVGGALLALYSLSALLSSYATLGGLIWLAVVVTLGARSTSAALIAGLIFTTIPGVFLQYLSPSISEVPTAMFGIGAILVARNPDGLVAMHGRQLRGIRARWSHLQNRSGAVGQVDVQPRDTDVVLRSASVQHVLAPPTSSKHDQDFDDTKSKVPDYMHRDESQAAKIMVLRAEDLLFDLEVSKHWLT